MSWSSTSSNPVRDRSCDASVGQLPSGLGTAVPLVKPTLRGILPHGSEVPRGPIPLRSAGLDDSPCCQTSDVDSSKTNPLFHRRTPCVTLPTSIPDQIRHCVSCATPLDSTRAIYCSAACKQRRYRDRQVTTRRARVGIPAPERARSDRVAHTVYECSNCGERFVGLRGCPDCNLFLRNLGLGGACAHCDEPLLLTELLGDGGVTLLD